MSLGLVWSKRKRIKTKKTKLRSARRKKIKLRITERKRNQWKKNRKLRMTLRILTRENISKLLLQSLMRKEESLKGFRYQIMKILKKPYYHQLQSFRR